MTTPNRIERLSPGKRKVEVKERLRAAARAREVAAECNRVLVRASDENELLREMCRILVKSGGYRMAWIGMVEHDAGQTIRPVASAGGDSGYLESAGISWADNEFGQGPAGLAVRSRKPQAARHLQSDPPLSTRYGDAMDSGCHSAASLPLISGNDVVGVLGVQAVDPEAFATDELALLDELAHDIAYGLVNLRLRAGQQRAEQLLHLEHTVTRCLAGAESAAAALKVLIRAICESEGWDCGRYFRVDEPAGVLRFEEAWGVPSAGIEKFLDRSRTLTYAAGTGLVGRIWQSGEPLWIADISQDARAVRAAYTAESGIRGAFLFPVTSGGRTTGVLNFSSREIREPDERLLQAVRVIGSQIGQFLHRMRGADELRRFRAAMELSGDSIMLVDRGTMRFIDVNQTACEQTGYTREELLRMGPHDLGSVTRDAHERLYDEMIAGDQVPARLVGTRRHKDGSIVSIESYRSVVRTESGPIIVAVVRDISERVRADQLRNLEHAVAHSLAESEDAASAMKAVIRAICEGEGWECGRYFHADEAAGVLRYLESWHVAEAAFEQFIERSRGTEFQRGAGLVGTAWQSGQPLWSADMDQEPRALRRRHAVEIGLHASFVFPVTAEGKTIGVLSFASRKARQPDEGLLQAVLVIGSQIGQYLRRKQAEAVLRESEARFRSLTSVSSDWYWEQDADYRFVDMTTEIDRRTGVSALAHIGKRRWELPAPNMTEADWTAHRVLVEAHQPFHDLQLCRYAADGKIAWVSISGEPILDAEGRFTGYRGIGKDITVRKRAEQLQALEHAVTRSLGEADSAAEALRAVIRAVCETEGWECGRYFRVDDAANVLRLSEFWHTPDPAMERFVEASSRIVFARGVGLSGRAWESGEPLWSTDIQNDPRALQAVLFTDFGIRGAFDFPVTSAGRTIGVLAFSSRHAHEPDDPLLRAVGAIGSQIGQFLHRKQIEETIHTQALQQRLIAEFGQQALASPDVGEMLDQAARLVATTLQVDYANVLELQPDGQSLKYQAAVGWPAEWIGHRTTIVRPGSRLNHILSQREPLVIDDFTDETRFFPSPLLAFGVRSGVQVPIFGPKGIFGVMSVHTLTVRRFTDEDVSFLRSVANILGIGIERKNAENKLAHLAQFDTVTGLPNRHLFLDRLGQSLTQAQRNRSVAGVLFVDLDRFKAVNDTFGHSVGDKLLREVAARLKQCVRAGDTVARLSGDEFAVVLSSFAKADDAGLVAQKIVKALSAPFDLEGHRSYISASIGIALYPGDGSEADTLVKNADTAMYRAKEQGRNCYRYYLPQMNERLMERLQLETRLRGALERGEFRLHYQPKVQLDTGTISGFEALLRWEQDGKLVPPLEFISILEDTGLIVPVGEWVLRTACGQIGKWTGMGIVPRPVAVNLSARQFQQKSLAATVRQILQETGVAPDLLELELTETLLMSDAEEAVQMLRELKDLGVRLAVDDFGTGYSSLAYLKRFPLDTLKIDRAFIRDAVSNPDDATLTLAIINLAHSMRLKVVAEGVETEGQLHFLRLHGCDEMQGYYFARPMAGDDCTQALVEDRRLQQPEMQPPDGLPVLLLVGTNEEDLALMKRALAADGFRILTANCAAAGFEMLACHSAAIVISDYSMPGMSGVEFLTKVRKLYPDAVRVVTAASDNPPTLTGMINSAGIHKFLSKSWDADRLRAEVREAYRQQP